VRTVARIRLGYTARETGHLTLGRFLNEFDIFKLTFNLEKLGRYEYDDGHLDSIEDFINA
jgi:hypothetical protein